MNMNPANTGSQILSTAGLVQDRFFELDYENGPFATIASFNDWLLAAAARQKPGPGVINTGPVREYLPDTGRIYFTHGDPALGQPRLLTSPVKAKGSSDLRRS